MLDPHKIMITVRRAADLFRTMPGRHGGVVSLDESAEDVMVVGDLHGNIPAFRQVLANAALKQNPHRHLVLQELVHGPTMYPDEGGDKSHQLVDVVSALKCEFPNQVHLILGNHELSELTGRPIGKNGVYLNELFAQGLATAYGAAAGDINQAYHELFAALPLAVRTPNRVFICHTVPDAHDLEQFDLGILGAQVWPPESMARGGTVYAMTWGRDTSPETADRFAQMIDADLFICGHQPCDDGFLVANHRQLIVDGTDPLSAYCLFPAREPVTMERLVQGVHVFPPRS